MAMKIFTVKNGSKTKIRIKELIEEGVARLQPFPNEKAHRL
ncbi:MULTISPECIES: hypothetical protein [Bacillus cereus group]|nr:MULTISPECIES: hypothetical protein [Bacillus cereus group]MDM5465323.1 hypothetical protein [Bacillus cereus]